jgi:cathepsin A (carboxypeptidase C)
MKLITFSLLMTFCFTAFDPNSILNIDNLMFPNTPISQLPYNSFFPEPELHGLIEINEEKDDKIFYWLFPSRDDPDKDPLVIWLTGGPGCSSELAIFYENGPMKLEDGEAVKQDISWNNRSNLLYIDQPIGTGFSDADPADIPKFEQGVADQFEIFIVKFYEKFPAFKGRDLFITGESYAGHYVPYVSERVMSSEKCKEAGANLIGSAIGNGWVNPNIQFMNYARYAYDHGIIDLKSEIMHQLGFSVCTTLLNWNFYNVGRPLCGYFYMSVLGKIGDPDYNLYDVRLPCEVKGLCYDFSAMEKYLNRDDVQQALDLRKQVWETCSSVVSNALYFDYGSDVTPKVKALLEGGKRVLVYSGEYDYSCNWEGGYAWIKAMEWEHQSDFNNQEFTNIGYGNSIKVSNLHFIKFFNAGHMVPMDQPQYALDMLHEFIYNWKN